MSDFSAAIASGLSALGTVTGQTQEYRVGKSGTWTALVGGFVTYDPPMPLGFDENRREIIGPMTARLKMPAAARPILVPNTPEGGGYYVRVGGTTVWAVTGVQQVDFAQAIYSLKREEVVEARAQVAGSV